MNPEFIKWLKNQTYHGYIHRYYPENLTVWFVYNYENEGGRLWERKKILRLYPHKFKTVSSIKNINFLDMFLHKYN